MELQPRMAPPLERKPPNMQEREAASGMSRPSRSRSLRLLPSASCESARRASCSNSRRSRNALSRCRRTRRRSMRRWGTICSGRERSSSCSTTRNIGSHRFRPRFPAAAPGRGGVFVYDFSTYTVRGTKPHEERGYWRDVGTRRAYSATQRDVRGSLPRLDLDNPWWPDRSLRPALTYRASTRIQNRAPESRAAHRHGSRARQQMDFGPATPARLRGLYFDVAGAAESRVDPPIVVQAGRARRLHGNGLLPVTVSPGGGRRVAAQREPNGRSRHHRCSPASATGGVPHLAIASLCGPLCARTLVALPRQERRMPR